MRMSFFRSVILRKPSLSTSPISPVWNHFSESITVALAKKTGVTAQDLTLFWHVFELMLEHDRAAARAGLALRGLYVFTHDDAFGRAPAHELADLINITPRHDATARSLDDYQLRTPKANELPAGVTLTTLLPKIPAPRA